LILTFIEVEISSANENTMFRQNSAVTRMFKYYCKSIGVQYLFKTLARYVAELEASNRQGRSENTIFHSMIELEVDPFKMDEKLDEQAKQVNKLQLMLITQKVFNGIIKSADTIPLPLLVICGHVKRLVSEKFPGKDLEYKAVSAFLFLRFICPAIAAPHAYGLSPNPPTEVTQRQLILLSKVLQNLANGQRFGKKEEFMSSMNDFIDNNILTLQAFYNHLPEPRLQECQAVVIPKQVKENALMWMHQHIVLNKQRLFQEISTSDQFENAKEITQKLTQLIEKLGPAPEKNKHVHDKN